MDTRYLHVTVRCPSCGHEVDLGAYEATLDLDLDQMRLRGSFRAGHRCSPPKPDFVITFADDADEALTKRIRDLLRRGGPVK